MKTKVTLSIEKELVPRAKRCASRQRRSLSSLVEEALRRAAEQSETPFSARWRGRFKPSEGRSPRRRFLAERYL